MARARPPHRAPWAPALHEAEALEYAQATKFNTLMDDIQADPSGRGRTPALSSVGMQPAADAQQIHAAQEAALRALPPERNPVEVTIGDATITREPPAPPEPAPNQAQFQPPPAPPEPPPNQVQASFEAPPAPPEPGPSPAAAAPAAPQSAPVQARHVKAPDMAQVDPGPAPESQTDNFLRNLPAAAAYFIEGAGQNRYAPGVQQRLDSYTAQNMDRNAALDQERKQYGRRKAALERAAQKEFAQGQTEAERENYKRDEAARTENQTTQRYEQDRAEDARRYGVAEQRWQSMNSPEARAAEREANMEDAKALKTFGTDEEIRQAKALRQTRRGGGPGRANVQQAYAGALDALAQKYGGVDKIPPMERQQLDLAAQSKDAIGALRQVTSGYVTRDASEAKATQAQEAKAQAGRKQAEASSVELQRIIDTAKTLKARGEKYVPGNEPLVGDGGASARYKRGKAMLMGDPERGSTGFTSDQALVTTASELLAQAEFHATTGQTANMAAERQKAEARFKNNNTLDGLIRELEASKARLDGTLQSGAYVPRDENGNVLSAPAPVQAPQPVRVRTQDGEEIELVDP